MTSVTRTATWKLDTHHPSFNAHFGVITMTTTTKMQRRQCSTVLLAACLLTCEAFIVQRLQQQVQIQRAFVQSPRSKQFLAPLSLLAPTSLSSSLQPQQHSPSFTHPHKRATRNTLLHLHDNDDDYDDGERVRVPRGGRRRRYEDEYETRQERRYYDDDEEDEYYDDEYYDEDDDDDDDEFDVDFEFDRVVVDEEYASDILIPNPILDNVDPEGAGERFGEIAKDPTFWRDVLIAIAVFNFCEYVAQVPYY